MKVYIFVTCIALGVVKYCVGTTVLGPRTPQDTSSSNNYDLGNAVSLKLGQSLSPQEISHLMNVLDSGSAYSGQNSLYNREYIKIIESLRNLLKDMKTSYTKGEIGRFNRKGSLCEWCKEKISEEIKKLQNAIPVYEIELKPEDLIDLKLNLPYLISTLKALNYLTTDIGIPDFYDELSHLSHKLYNTYTIVMKEFPGSENEDHFSEIETLLQVTYDLATQSSESTPVNVKLYVYEKLQTALVHLSILLGREELTQMTEDVRQDFFNHIEKIRQLVKYLGVIVNRERSFSELSTLTQLVTELLVNANEWANPDN